MALRHISALYAPIALIRTPNIHPSPPQTTGDLSTAWCIVTKYNQRLTQLLGYQGIHHGQLVAQVFDAVLPRANGFGVLEAGVG